MISFHLSQAFSPAQSHDFVYQKDKGGYPPSSSYKQHYALEIIRFGTIPLLKLGDFSERKR
jgi:hypothetical protein